MPWVSDTYSLPAGTTVSPNTTIQSTWANTLTADLQSGMNFTRPISRGGTGATTAVGAADNLSTISSDIASSSTTDLSNATGIHVTITGTTTITGFGTEQAGAIRVLTFDDALTLTHNATSLILPGGANVTTDAGDVAVFVSLGSGNWRCTSYLAAESAPGLDSWAAQPIGVPIPIFAHLFDTVAEALPPTDRTYRYILLTAGEDGVGEYNEDILINESVSGSAPLVLATADIDYAASPIDGATVSLINTEGRYIIAGATSGVVRMDQFQDFQVGSLADADGPIDLFGLTNERNSRPTGTAAANNALPRFTAGSGQGDVRRMRAVGDGTNGTPRQGTDTHGKDISAVFVMRIA